MSPSSAGVALLGLALCLGCVTPPPTQSASAEAGALERALAELEGAPDRAQVARLASAAVEATAALRARYRPLRPALAGNAAFHLGLRDRALCCHWTEDLLRRLAALRIEGFALHWAVAHHGNPLREHSAVVVVPEGGRFGEGLVLDAWRDSGRLFWTRVAGDRYPWTLHPADAQQHRLRCSEGGT